MTTTSTACFVPYARAGGACFYAKGRCRLVFILWKKGSQAVVFFSRLAFMV
ncbi:hypothetical protein [uncultured Megasphaera sp.]|uniref:hypothetical protein n=1 Tax=uncultured Megasphaera sp. TaxID=165188 RepID=UPI00259B3DB1|nr:hypothetical protein [uncultured Megasphaera sp.]